MGAAVCLSHVVKKYHEVYAVRDLSLKVEPGEFLTLLGPSGSGKTTTLMMLAGLVQPTSGQIAIDGQDVTYLPPYRRNIGVVFQNYALFPHMAVFENIAFPLRRRGVPRAEVEERVAAALELVQLSGLGRRQIDQLSGGQQQRVALARALVFRPPLLLMDEPLGALDKKLREQMQIEITHIMESIAITVIYVTHDQEEALSLSGRIAVLRGGVLEQVGTPEELYDRPGTPFVADFVGSTNLLKGEVVAEAAGLATVRTRAGLDFRLGGWSGQSGGAVAASLRPERIRIWRLSEAAVAPNDRSNRIQGRILDRIFAGGVVKFLVLAGGENFTVCSGNEGESAKLRKGDDVVLAWQPEDTHIVSDG